jgi:hypothetical protein
MKPLANYVDTCLPVSEERFAKTCRSVFFVHSRVKDGALTPIEDTSSDTFSRLREVDKPQEDDPLVTVSFRIVEMEFPSRTRKLSIGSSSSCDVQINDESVSRHHANMFAKDGVYTITDSDSALGTTLNGNLLKPGEVKQIRTGDRIRMGKVNLVFLLPAEFHRMVCGMYNR